MARGALKLRDVVPVGMPRKRTPNTICFEAAAEDAAYLKAYYDRMYSDARAPGDVLAFVLRELVRADRDKDAHGRAVDRMRFTQERTNSRSHIEGRIIQNAFVQLPTHEALDGPFGLGRRMYLTGMRDRAMGIRAPKRLDAGDWMKELDAEWKVHLRTSGLAGPQEDKLFQSGVAAAFDQCAAIVTTVVRTMEWPGIMTHHELIAGEERDTPLNWPVASVDVLRGILARLRESNQPLDPHELRRGKIQNISGAALDDGLRFLEEVGLVRRYSDPLRWDLPPSLA